MFSVIIPQAYLAVPIRCFFAAQTQLLDFSRKVLMCGAFGEIVCWQKESRKKKSLAGSQGFLYWKACREEHRDAGDAVYPCWPQAQNAE